MQCRILGNGRDVVLRRSARMNRMFALHCSTLYSRNCCTGSETTGICRRDGSKNNQAIKKERGVVKVPSIIFFGGDIVSLVALKTLHERLQAISSSSSSSSETATAATTTTTTGIPSYSPGSSYTVHTEKKQPLVVVCPFLPAAPGAISQRYRRQYPVARYCVEHNIPLVPVDHPTSLARSGTLRYLLLPRHTAEQKNSHNSGAFEMGDDDQYITGQPLEAFDVAVIVSFRYFLPNKLLERLPRTINVHPSLLPRYRGASPIFAPLLRGDTEGGVSVIKLLPHQQLMDSGDVLWQQSVPVPREMTICEYFPLVTKLGGVGLCECLFSNQHAWHPDTDLREVGVATDIVLRDVSRSTVCAWPQCFDAKWSSAWPQNYNVHYKEDPYHAPLLPKDRAVIKWHVMTAEEAYGTWRAFVGGEYYSPSVNAILDKGATPIREQLLGRLLLRAAREIKTKIRHYRERDELASQERKDEEVSVLTSPSINSEAGSSGTVEEMLPALKDHSHFHRHLLTACSFTSAVHPKDFPSAVVRELELVETGEDNLAGASLYTKMIKKDHYHNVKSKVKPGSAYFPVAVEDMCAVKCREGWFVWQAVSLKGSSARSAVLFRKGTAMKTGVLYTSLFVDNDKAKEEEGATAFAKK